MRKSKLTAAEMEAADRSADKRRKDRGQGFDMMKVRDRGWGQLTNGVTVRWPHEAQWSEEINGVMTREPSLPEGSVMLDNTLYDIDELQKFLRWA